MTKANCISFLAALEDVDPDTKVIVGGHAGIHGKGFLFLSGGAGLAFSNAFSECIGGEIQSQKLFPSAVFFACDIRINT